MNELTLSNTLNKVIKDFFRIYPSYTYSDILYDVLCVCAFDEKFGLSDNRKYSIVEFLERCSKFINAVHFLSSTSGSLKSDPKVVRIDRSKLDQLEKEIDNISGPFWDVHPSEQKILSRLKYEKYPDLIALKGQNKNRILHDDLEVRFFTRYGLKESLDLIDHISKNYFPKYAPQGKKGEVCRFTKDLKYLLTALYLNKVDQQRRVGGVHG